MNKFSILVAYQGKKVIATVEQLKSAIEYQYNVKFPDGFNNIFYTSEEEPGWFETTLGPTELSQAVGEAIDLYSEEHIQPTEVEIDGEKYIVLPRNDDRNLFYEVSSGNTIFIMGMGEAGKWEASADIDEKIVSAIGNIIEEKEL
ncbi:MAG TPA: hypothetical protein PLA68_15560 [Panacibacter sp.]|nr:hypothetical protein [Panacibacter sp.]